jgi:hypothetical protein
MDVVNGFWLHQGRQDIESIIKVEDADVVTLVCQIGYEGGLTCPAVTYYK